MAIGSAVQKGAWVYVYDERGQSLCTLTAGTEPQDGLKGYTSTSVTIRLGVFVYTYNERGSIQSTVSVF